MKFYPCNLCIRRKSPDFFPPYSTNSDTTDTTDSESIKKSVFKKYFNFSEYRNPSYPSSVIKKKRFSSSLGLKFAKAFRKLSATSVRSAPKQRCSTLGNDNRTNENAYYDSCYECKLLGYPEADWWATYQGMWYIMAILL